MNSAQMRDRLHQYINDMPDNKVAALYTVVETDINAAASIYTKEFVSELREREEYYNNGGEMVTKDEIDEKVAALLNRKKSQ